MAERIQLSILVLNLEQPGHKDGELLERTLNSLRDQGLDHKDEVIVVMYRESPIVRDLWRNAGFSGILIRPTQATDSIPGTHRIAPGNHSLVVRNGDAFLPGALQHLRETIAGGPTATAWQFETNLSLLDGQIADLHVDLPIVLRPPRNFMRNTDRTVVNKFWIKGKKDEQRTAPAPCGNASQ